MLKMKKYSCRCIIVNLFLLSIVFGCSDPIDISNYKGDGKIDHIGNKNFYPGFKIDLGEIDLSKAFAKEFKLINTPEIDKLYTIGFIIEEKEQIERPPHFFNGRILLKAINGKDKILFSFSSSLKDWRETVTIDDNTKRSFLFFMNQVHKSYFTLNEAKPIDMLSIFISYNPPIESYNERTTLKIQMRVGGSK
jgi:hypothetical protein